MTTERSTGFARVPVEPTVRPPRVSKDQLLSLEAASDQLDRIRAEREARAMRFGIGGGSADCDANVNRDAKRRRLECRYIDEF